MKFRVTINVQEIDTSDVIRSEQAVTVDSFSSGNPRFFTQERDGAVTKAIGRLGSQS